MLFGDQTKYKHLTLKKNVIPTLHPFHLTVHKKGERYQFLSSCLDLTLFFPAAEVQSHGFPYLIMIIQYSKEVAVTSDSPNEISAKYPLSL